MEKNKPVREPTVEIIVARVNIPNSSLSPSGTIFRRRARRRRERTTSGGFRSFTVKRPERGVRRGGTAALRKRKLKTQNVLGTGQNDMNI